MYTQAADHHDPTPYTKASGREYRLFRARSLKPGNERGCVEPPELERSSQLVTAGRDVRRWCLHTAVHPAIAHAIPCHPEHREGSFPISSHPSHLHPASIPRPPASSPPSPLLSPSSPSISIYLPPQPLSHLASTQSSPLLPPHCPFSAAPRFRISLIVNIFQFCLGENSPKQNQNAHTLKHLQKRPVSRRQNHSGRTR